MRMELTRLVSGRLSLPESLAETMLANGRAPEAHSTGDRSAEGRSRRAILEGSPTRGPSGRSSRTVHRVAAGGRTGARAWTCRSISRASCCAARPGIWPRGVCRSR
jgi:hypothetical protein